MKDLVYNTFLLLCLLVICGVEDSWSAEESLSEDAEKSSVINNKSSAKKVSGFLDFNLYYDTRDFSVFTFNALSNLPNRFQYFSLTNFYNSIDTDRNTDLTSFYTEQHLRWNFIEDVPLDLTMLWNIQSGSHNDTLRFGLRWRVTDTKWWDDFFKKIGFSYSINFHALQIELNENPGKGWQIEHVYYWLIFPKTFEKRIYFGGFADHNMRYGSNFGSDNHVWVTEHQLGIRTIDQFFIIAEFRRNEFLSEKNGLGLGLEYKIKF